MQPRPALPWSADTERGTIRLNKYVSQQDLLDGILKWTVSDYHGTDVPGVIARTSGNKLVLQDGNGQTMYEIADFSYSTNVLELTRVPGSSESLINVEFPAVIAPQGDVQVFKDRFGYELATGTLSKVYVRINTPWVGDDSGWGIGAPQIEETCFVATSPTGGLGTYAFSLWVDWTSEERNTPFEAGQMVEVTYGIGDSLDVSNYQKIFNAHDPLPVEGDVQIFADASCLTIPAGQLNTVYARINKPWGFGGFWSDGEASDSINCHGPNTEAPNDPYFINLWIDFNSSDSSTPYQQGQLVVCAAIAPTDVTGKQHVFSNPVRLVPTGPWEGGAGGTLRFSSPISLQQILNGRLILDLYQNGEVSGNVRFYENQGVVKVMSWENIVFGVTLSPSQEAATELILDYIYSDNSFSLENARRLNGT